MSLVIVESPGKCKTIQGYLGHGWRVMASMGHLRALVPALDSVGIAREFEPTYEWIKEKAATIKALKEAAKEATEIYVAADDDREGEFIAYSVCLLLKLNPKTAKRAVFHEITEAAIQHAIHHPRHIDMNRVHAQQARSMLDMMIGFTISPLLWKYVAPSLSAGRCQTPALRLVVEREDAIQSFQATSSWKLTAMMRTLSSSSFPSPSSASPFGMTMDDELEDEESAQNYLELVHATPHATVLHTATKPWTESAPDPLMTSTLQQQASALFHMNPQSTMRIAQSLYEAGHITYMRTDQAVLSEDVKREAREWVATNVGPHYVSPEDLKPPTKGLKGTSGGAKREGCGQSSLAEIASLVDTPAKGGQCVSAQQAHEAIRPTHITTLQAGKDAQEQKIYRLIWQRTVQSVMSSARGETDHMTCHIDEEFRWSTSWRRTIHEGWKRIGQVANLDQEDEKEDNKDSPIRSLTPGDRLEWTTMKAEPKETKAQGRYTEAQLVRALETHGIGRPSTFASLLSVIQEKKYVECVDLPPRPVPVKEWSLVPHQWPPTVTASVKQVGAEKKKMVPTPLGRAVLHFLLTHMEDLFAYTFTAHMERRLDAIAEGAEEGATLLRDTWRSYQDRYEGLLQCPKEPQKGPQQGPQEHVKRRTFSEGLLAVQTKKGPLLLKEGATKEDTVFYGWPKKATWDSLTDEEAHAFVTSHQKEQMGQQEELGEWKGTPMIRKKGKFGEYIQWGTVSVSLVQGESLEALQGRLEAKEAGGSAVLATFASYVIRNGPYGPYIMKTSVQKKQYVSLPKGVDPAALTEKEVAALYQLGLQSKKKRPS